MKIREVLILLLIISMELRCWEG
ncbi:hypothetical protein AT5G58790 [Arabidopsis thaliana]|uniref:Uncharacterized protein n=1 Tax=Arabidopsis thaliana TaxID=3702 RepID=Q3E894_ARATH|nr:uncharacterized protein AT5G58790 [Arabidopsis thaliana]AED97102.1 hypothetical protein AT5G58790 [Arabidopsis thaliana]|eukprot:NP_001336503.1 hypothetical protein AT5G58790 [Arabidopsis thaliana]